MTITLCVLLWAHEGQHDGLVAFEDEVLAFIPDHGGRVVERVRTITPAADDLSEVHVLEFPSQEALDHYLQDPRRLARLDQRDRVIARTELLRVARH